MSILDYLPRRAKNDTLIQGRIPLGLALEVKKVMVRRKLSMSDVLTACFRHFLAATEIDDEVARRNPRLNDD